MAAPAAALCSVRATASVERTATPSAPPTCRAVLLRPDASPESRSGELAFISTVATSGTAVEVASELSIESFFPADRATAAALRAAGRVL